MDPVTVIRRAGGVASRRTLMRTGCNDRSIRAAIDRGVVRRLRPGWFATSSAPAEVVRAVSAGGWLTCTSALRLQGVWTMPASELHVAVARGRGPRPGRGLDVHWTDRRMPTGYPMDDVTHAVREAVHCLDRRACVVLLDSVLDKGLLRPHELTALLNETARGRQLARLVDVSESGTETLARLALRRLRLPVRTQVPVRGVGRVDLVIGDRLVLEVDGEEWHDRASTFEQDRSRDRALTVMGFIVMRASYKQVMHEWALVEEQVLAIVRRNEHRWTSRGRRSPRI